MDTEKITIPEKSPIDDTTKYQELFNNMQDGVAVYRTVDGGNRFVFSEYNKSAERLDCKSREQVIGRDVTDVFPGVEKFGLLDVFRRVYKTGEPEYMPTTEYRDEHSSYWRENYVYKLPNGEIVAVYSDVTERKKAELSLIREVQLNNALAGISGKLISGTDRSDISSEVLKHALRLTSSSAGYAGHFDSVSGELVISTSVGFPEKAMKQRRLSIGSAKASSVIVVNDTAREKIVVPMPATGFPIKRIIAAPAKFSGDTLGLVTVANSGSPYTDEDLDAVVRIAALFGISIRFVRTQQERERLIIRLENALARVKTLSGLLPICASCKKIRDDKGYWHQVDVFVRDHTDAEFSHSLCPACLNKLYPDENRDDRK